MDAPNYGDPNGGTDPQQPVDPLIQLLAGLRPPPGTAANPAVTPMPTSAPAAPVTPKPLYAQPTTPGYQPPSTVPVGVPPPQMPTPPAPPSIDLAKRASLASTLNKDQQPTDPNDPSVKARWYDRVLGGLVGFGQGFQHNRNAVEEGGAVTNRRYNTAEGLRANRVQADEGALGQFDKSTEDQNRDYENKNQQFGHEMEGIKETRAQQTADASGTLKAAQAERWAAMSPQERVAEVPDIEKSLGRPLDPEEKQNFILYGKPEKGAKSGGSPKTIQEGLFSNDPGTRQQAQGYFDQEHKSNERAAQAAARANQPKPATKGEFSSVQKDRNKAWTKADSDYQKDYDEQVKPLYDAAHAARNDKDRAAKIDLAKQADKELTDRLFKSKQDAQDEYESGIETLGGGSKHVDVKGGAQPSARKTPPQQASQAVAARQNNAPPPDQPSKTAGQDFGAAPTGSKDGRTGKLQNGTPVVVKGGRLVGQ